MICLTNLQNCNQGNIKPCRKITYNYMEIIFFMPTFHQCEEISGPCCEWNKKLMYCHTPWALHFPEWSAAHSMQPWLVARYCHDPEKPRQLGNTRQDVSSDHVSKQTWNETKKFIYKQSKIKPTFWYWKWRRIVRVRFIRHMKTRSSGNGMFIEIEGGPDIISLCNVTWSLGSTRSYRLSPCDMISSWICHFLYFWSILQVFKITTECAR